MIFNPTVSGRSETGLELVTGSIPASDAWSKYNFGYLSENQIMEIISNPAAQQVRVVKGSIFYINSASELALNKTVIGADPIITENRITVSISSGAQSYYRTFVASGDFSIS